MPGTVKSPLSACKVVIKSKAAHGGRPHGGGPVTDSHHSLQP